MDANIKTPQDALEWLDRSIREEAEIDGEMSSANAIRLGFIQNMLAKFPRRNCDVGTLEEQAERFAEYCDSEVCKRNRCKSQAKALCIERCALAWAQMPYKEGGAK